MTAPRSYLITLSMKFSVLAFSNKVLTLLRSRPEGTSASISRRRGISLPGRVVNCSIMPPLRARWSWRWWTVSAARWRLASSRRGWWYWRGGKETKSQMGWLTNLQLKLIKIGARVVRHARAITFQLAEVAVTGPMVRAILAEIRRLRAPPLSA
jgi:hypothetical protein